MFTYLNNTTDEYDRFHLANLRLFKTFAYMRVIMDQSNQF